MSIDVWLETDTGGPPADSGLSVLGLPAEVTECRHVSDNLLPTLRAAGADLPSLDLVPVAELRSIIHHATWRLSSDPERFPSAPDGSTIARCLDLLDALTVDCAAHPMAIFRSR